jgi:hypothetical protein
MAWQSCRRGFLCVALTAGLAAWAGQALAGEASYCVTCKDPDQTYLCQVDADGVNAGDALKLYCIMRSAKEGHHGSCAAERATTSCNGVVKVYSYDGPVPEDLIRSAKHFADKIKQSQETFEKPKGDQPKTLVELTGRAFSASRQGLRNARNRLTGAPTSGDQPVPPDTGSPNYAHPPGQASAPPAAETTPAPDGGATSLTEAKAASSSPGFMRRSYRCMLSLFRKCSGQPSEEEALR